MSRRKIRNNENIILGHHASDMAVLNFDQPLLIALLGDEPGDDLNLKIYKKKQTNFVVVLIINIT